MNKLYVLYLHYKSLTLGGLFNFFYWSLGREAYLTGLFLTYYRNTRRPIPGGKDSKTGLSTRYGASQAHEQTQKH